MKRILLSGFLALVAGTMAFAQQWPDGFSVSGHLRTGLRADFFSGDYYTDAALGSYGDFKNEEDRSMFSFWHDDSGNRVQLDMKYTQENFGFRFIPRWRYLGQGAAGPTVNTQAQIAVAYGWFEVLNDMVRISAGLIDDGQWVSPTPVDRHYSNGKFRVEVKPIDGLNFGWAVGEGNHGLDNGVTQGNGAGNNMGQVFGNSAFGAKYASDMFTVAAGLELRPDSTSDGRRSDGSDFTASMVELSIGGGSIEAGTNAVSAYAGFEVKPVQGLTVQVGVDSGNLDKADELGFIHLNEYLAYSLGGITPRVELHQVMSLQDTDKVGKWTDPDGESKDIPVYMEFIPGVDFTASDSLSCYIEVPVKLMDKEFELGVKPGLNYTFGPGLSIGAYYKLTVNGGSYDAYDDHSATMQNTVQINFGWSF